MNTQSKTSAPAPTTRAFTVARRIHIMQNDDFLPDFRIVAEGDNVVAYPDPDSVCVCTYSFPRGWGSKRISAFLWDRVKYGE
jgi:hypothetical protein